MLQELALPLPLAAALGRQQVPLNMNRKNGRPLWRCKSSPRGDVRWLLSRGNLTDLRCPLNALWNLSEVIMLLSRLTSCVMSVGRHTAWLLLLSQFKSGMMGVVLIVDILWLISSYMCSWASPCGASTFFIKLLLHNGGKDGRGKWRWRHEILHTTQM